MSVDSLAGLRQELSALKLEDGPAMLEVKASVGARQDLGRPTTGTIENRQKFMEMLQQV